MVENVPIKKKSTISTNSDDSLQPTKVIHSLSVIDLEAPSKISVVSMDLPKVSVTSLEQADTVRYIGSPTPPCTKRLTETLRRPFFITVALVVGVFYFGCPTPTIAYKETAEREGWEAPRSFVPYLFSLHSGIFVASTAIFVVYALVRKNNPFATPDLCLPALGSGLVWSGGITLWFFSTDLLGQSVAGPITAMLPCCVGSLWSVFYFREVKPGRSYVYMVVSIVLTLTGALAIGLAK